MTRDEFFMALVNFADHPYIPEMKVIMNEFDELNEIKPKPLGRPPTGKAKKVVSLRLSAEAAEWLKAHRKEIQDHIEKQARQ